VGTQLNSAMRKHGVTTRTALAVVIAQNRQAAPGHTGAGPLQGGR
jgi:hypothetical protein